MGASAISELRAGTRVRIRADASFARTLGGAAVRLPYLQAQRAVGIITGYLPSGHCTVEFDGEEWWLHRRELDLEETEP